MAQKGSPNHDGYQPEDTRAEIAQDLVRLLWTQYGCLYRRAIQDAEDDWDDEMECEHEEREI